MRRRRLTTKRQRTHKRGARDVRRVAVAVIALTLLAGALAGCSKCDPWWGGGRACHGAVPR